MKTIVLPSDSHLQSNRSSLSTPPLVTRLPWDVLHLILLHSDPQTLALVSTVSYDLLLSATPLLYGCTVRISSLHGLRALFHDRSSYPTSSRVNNQLSLSRVRNLTIDLRRYKHDPNLWTSSLQLSFSRLPFDRATFTRPPVLPLDRLQIILPPAATSLFTTLHTVLLPHLDPTSFSLTSQPGSPSTSSWHYLATYSPLLANFTHLKEIAFDGVIPVRRGGGSFLAGLPRRALFGLDRLVVDLNRYERGQLVVAWESHVLEFGLSGMKDGSIVLAVGTAQEEVEMKALVSILAPEAARLLTVEIKMQGPACPALLDVIVRTPTPSSP